MPKGNDDLSLEEEDEEFFEAEKGKESGDLVPRSNLLLQPRQSEGG